MFQLHIQWEIQGEGGIEVCGRLLSEIVPCSKSERCGEEYLYSYVSSTQIHEERQTLSYLYEYAPVKVLASKTRPVGPPFCVLHPPPNPLTSSTSARLHPPRGGLTIQSARQDSHIPPPLPLHLSKFIPRVLSPYCHFSGLIQVAFPASISQVNWRVEWRDENHTLINADEVLRGEL
jgi:hypothetical protein